MLEALIVFMVNGNNSCSFSPPWPRILPFHRLLLTSPICLAGFCKDVEVHAR